MRYIAQFDEETRSFMCVNEVNQIESLLRDDNKYRGHGRTENGERYFDTTAPVDEWLINEIKAYLGILDFYPVE